MREVQYKTFRSIDAEDAAECLNTMTKYGNEFSVISINHVGGYWVVFYSLVVYGETKRKPVDRSWVETVPVKDAHKEVRATYDNGPLPEPGEVDTTPGFSFIDLFRKR